jgi:hypothetical protein
LRAARAQCALELIDRHVHCPFSALIVSGAIVPAL